MIDVNELRKFDIALNELTGADAAYTMYYDETNNIRRLHTRADGLNVSEPKYFVIAGIAYCGPPRELNIDDLRQRCRIQKTTKANVLVESFGPFYVGRICLFKASHHILDVEKVIEDYLGAEVFMDGDRQLENFRFVVSHDEPGVQASDVIAGLLGKFFALVQVTDRDQLCSIRESLSNQQRQTSACSSNCSMDQSRRTRRLLTES